MEEAPDETQSGFVAGSLGCDLETVIPLNPGENIILRMNNVSLLMRTAESQTALGVLFVTNFQILHVSKSALPGSVYVQNNFIISVPVMTINSFQKKNIEGQGNRQIKLYTKDMRCLKITYNKTKTSAGVIKYLRAFIPLTSHQDLFAFRFQGSRAGWDLYDPIKEYNRMGIYLPCKHFDSITPTPALESPKNTQPLTPVLKKKGFKPWGKSRREKAEDNSGSPSPASKRSQKSDNDNLLCPKSPTLVTSHSDRAPSKKGTRRKSTDMTTSESADSLLDVQPVSIMRNNSARASRYTFSTPQNNPILDPILFSVPEKRKARHWKKIDSSSKVERQAPPHIRAGLARSMNHRHTADDLHESVFPLRAELRARVRKSFSIPDLRKLATHRQEVLEICIPVPPPLPPPSMAIWVLTDVNKEFEVSPTYPRYFCVPSQLKGSELGGCLSFRSKARIPVLCWKAPLSQVSMLRSSQPLVGMAGSHSSGDEQYLKYVLALNKKCKKLRIIDARGKNAANANHARGAGYEGSRYTNNCSISFMGIENIHTMRDSLNKVFEILKKRDDGYWQTSLESTGWLKHIRLVLQAARVVVDYIVDGDSVLVHCSDGWDRTSQICAIAEIALDPYYRTLEGFLILIEKEWIQFGHKFGERSGHTPGVSKSETSPVFLQFLDCVHQLQEQYPCSFEFNGSLLVYIMEEVFACRFGTFLANCVQETVEMNLPTCTASLWGDILEKKLKFTNALYAPNSGVLFFSCSSRTLCFWKSFFLRWDGECTPNEDVEGKLRYLLQEMEKRQDKLKSMHSELERKLDLSTRVSVSKPQLLSPHRRRFSSMIALQQVKSTSNVELAMRELVENILENSFIAIQNKNSDFESMFEPEENSTSNDDVVQRPWVPEHWAKACHLCNKKFSQLRRKHHCRNCGQVCCHNCTKSKATIPKFSIFIPVRICDICLPVIQAESRPELTD